MPRGLRRPSAHQPALGQTDWSTPLARSRCCRRQDALAAELRRPCSANRALPGRRRTADGSATPHECVPANLPKRVQFVGILPGVGKSHLLAALGHELILQGKAVLWTSTATLVQHLLAAK